MSDGLHWALVRIQYHCFDRYGEETQCRIDLDSVPHECRVVFQHSISASVFEFRTARDLYENLRSLSREFARMRRISPPF